VWNAAGVAAYPHVNTYTLEALTSGFAPSVKILRAPMHTVLLQILLIGLGEGKDGPQE